MLRNDYFPLPYNVIDMFRCECLYLENSNRKVYIFIIIYVNIDEKTYYKNVWKCISWSQKKDSRFISV